MTSLSPDFLTELGLSASPDPAPASPPAPDALSSYTAKLDALDADYQRMSATRAELEAECAEVTQRIENGNAQIAARRASGQAVPASWISLLNELRLRVSVLHRDIAALDPEINETVDGFTRTLDNYERAYDGLERGG